MAESSIDTEPEVMAEIKYVLPVNGLRCMSCVARLEKVLLACPDVVTAQVDLMAKNIHLQLQQRDALPAVIAAVEAAGFAIPRQVRQFQLAGLSCASCAGRVRQAALAQPGVLSADVQLLSQQLQLAVTADFSTEALSAAIDAAGYRLLLPPVVSAAADAVVPDTAAPDTVVASMVAPVSVPPEEPFWPVLLALLLSLPLVLPMVGLVAGRDWMLSPLWQWLLATPVQFWLGARFYRGAFYAVKNRSGNMDLLVALGTSAAYGLSLWHWLSAPAGHSAHAALYFESSALVLSFVLLGKYLEAQAKTQTRSALQALAELQPAQARVWQNDSADWQMQPLAQVRPGMRLQVKPGERIALDGVVVSGRSQVDEALVSGESLPLLKVSGDALRSGALNLDGVLEFAVSSTLQDSQLQQLIRQVEQAQLQKAPVQQWVDRIAAVFVPVVLGIAVLTLLAHGLWYGDWSVAILNAVAVLVIACPCALGLATPAALVVGLGQAARHGILLKNAAVLDSAAHLQLLAFDKTGTLTQGQPQITASLVLAGTAAEAQQLAAALQQHSEHPLAKAFRGQAGQALPAITEFQVLAGAGVAARLQGSGERFQLGSAQLLHDAGLTLPADWPQHDGSLVFLLQLEPQPQLVAAFWLQDQLRPDSAAAVRLLQAQGYRLVLLSGDNVRTVAQVATALGIDEYHGAMTPAAKLAYLQQAQQRGVRVAMTGDGINDAPALAQADLGIALQSGTEVAAAVAGIQLLDGDLRKVAAALDIARQTRRVIWQNLGWAFGFNVLAIPAAALGYLSPVLAGGAMALSSVLVVSNALRLKRWTPQLAQPQAAQP